ncbi:MAG TPA: 6-phosphogluconolactonase [Candidatus Saccharimonadales bacterium]|jgi:6-phosphogluconolactonase/glucosamine-6-phosphate isomerase/deaminase
MTELFEYKTLPSAVKAASDYLKKQINESSGKVLLLLSGGSSLNPVKEAFSSLDSKTLARIRLAQVDALLVPPEDELNNGRQIQEALGPNLDKTAGLTRVITMGDDGEDMAIAYEMELESMLNTSDYAIGVYGIGTDGRLAGMLPMRSPEDFTPFLDGRLVVNYVAADFERVATTQELLVRLDEVVVFATGPEKVKAVDKINQSLPAHKSPTQLLKDAKRATIFLSEEL